MKTAIRLDDISINMDYERFGRVEKILKDAGIRPLIGVVPDCKDTNLDKSKDSCRWPEDTVASMPTDREAFADFLRNLRKEGWVIAMHGYDHVYRTDKGGLFPLNRLSEFAGCDYEDQRDRLRKGMKIMEEMGVDTDIFMAPAHSYDMNTLKALYDVGIRIITDGFGTLPYVRNIAHAGGKRELSFYPIAKKRSDCISDRYGYTTLVLHASTMTDEDMVKLRDMIADHRDHFIDYADYLKIRAVPKGPFGGITEYLTATAKRILVSLRS